MQAIMTMMKSPLYWLAMVVLAMIAEAVALYYQYVLHDYPCVICIHIRLWVAAFILLGVAGLFLRGSKTGLRIANALVLLASIGLLERCYVLYGTENGLIDGSCSMFLGFPTWFAVDQWLPSLFEVQGACGITPDLLAGVSMAEGLLFIAVAVSLFSVLALALSLADPMHSED